MHFPIPVVFMISSAYLSEVELRSDWCQRAAAGRCPALLLFQLRFNTSRWKHQLPSKTQCDNLALLEISQNKISIVLYFFVPTGQSVAFDPIPLKNYITVSILDKVHRNYTGCHFQVNSTEPAKLLKITLNKHCMNSACILVLTDF